MAKYVYTMRRVSKTVPPQRAILKNISLNFFPGAKIGVLGLNGSGKSTLLKIMAGVDDGYEGEVIRMPGIQVGFLPQEPSLDPAKTVRESVEESRGELAGAKQRLDEVYAAYSEEGADFDKLAAEQAKLEAIVNAGDTGQELEIAADALRLPPWDQKVEVLSGVNLPMLLKLATSRSDTPPPLGEVARQPWHLAKVARRGHASAAGDNLTHSWHA